VAWLPWNFVVILVIFAVWYLAEARLAVSKALNPKALWVAAWPVGLSVGLYGIFYLYWRKSERTIEQIIPASDIWQYSTAYLYSMYTGVKS
jgi:hypothetical protein